EGFRLTEVSRWAKKHLSSGGLVSSDGLACFSAVKDAGCEHKITVTGGGYESVTKKQFIWVNTMIGNVKNSISGTYHSVRDKHLPRYFAEFCYRFNRRFSLKDMLPLFMFVAMRTPPMPQKLLSMAEAYG
ncbi:MAG: IS1595 family transposase, partial [Colwellia sp.]